MALTKECLDRLGLREQPFAPVTTGAFVYNDTLLDTQIERLLEVLQPPGAILLLSACGGAGRSTQVMRLLGSLPGYFQVIAFRGRKKTNFASVDVTIRKHLRLRTKEESGLPLKDLLIEQGSRGIDMLIAVDDAHLLGAGILRELLELAREVSAASARAPRLLLASDTVLGRNYPHILSLHDDHQVRHVALAALNQEQAGAYLRHRLAAAGNAGFPALFKPEILANLHKRSRGLPGALNTIVEEWLADYCDAMAHAREHPKASPSPSETDEDLDPDQDADVAAEPVAVSETLDDPPQRELDSGADASALEAAGEDADKTSTEQTETQERRPPVAFWRQPWLVPTAVGLGVMAVILSIALQMPEAEFMFPSMIPGRKPPEGDSPASLPGGAAPGDEGEADPGSESSAESSAESSDEDALLTEILSRIAQPAPELAPDSSPDSSPDLVPDLTENPRDAALPEPIGESADQGAVPQPPSAASPGEEGAESEAPAADAPVATGAVAPPSSAPEPDRADNQPATDVDADERERIYQTAITRADLSWLAQQNPDHLTIQLIALRTVAAVEEYLARYRLEGAQVIPSGPVVIAVFGSFEDTRSAMAALGALPTAVLAQGYWIRSIGDVQRDARR